MIKGPTIHAEFVAYTPKERDDRNLVRRIRELAAARVRYGYRRITVLLQRAGWRVGRRSVYRLYKAEGLKCELKSERNGLRIAGFP